MRKKIVIWGTQTPTDSTETKVLIAIALNSQDNNLDIYVFSEEAATETFYTQMIQDWRENKPVEFPEGYQHIQRPLTASESILPDDLKADNPDVIHRAQMEWPIHVLAEKLYKVYREELDELKNKVDEATEFKRELWDELQQYWSKVQEQARSKILNYNNVKELREETNELFSTMKELRKKVDAELRETSKKIKREIEEALKTIDQKTEKGLSLKILFEDLKKLQAKVKESAQLIRSDRNTLWKHIDKRFKAIKEKRFGPEGEDNKLIRLQRRLDGLIRALYRLKKSVQRDEKEIKFQKDRINNAANQLEAQIREAKLVMLEDRIQSKKEKIKEMEDIEKTLLTSIEKEKQRIEDRKKREESKRLAEEKLKEELNKSKQLVESEGYKLKDAVEKVKSAKKESEDTKQETPASSITEQALSAIRTTMSESLGDVVDTIKAVANVLGDHADEVVEELKDKAGHILEEIKEDTADIIEEVKEKIDESLNNQKEKSDREKAPTQASGQASDQEE